MVPEIQPILLSNSFVPQAAEASGKTESAGILVKAALFSIIHFMIMQTWKSFHDQLRETADKNNEEHTQLEKRDDALKAMELQGEKRHLEVFDDTYERRQAARFQIWDGPHSNGSRHLDFQV